MRDDYRRELAEREIKVEKSDFNIDNMLTTMRQYYRGGRYDFLLNSTENINREWIDQYLNEAHSYGLTSVRAHFNVMAWSDDAEELKHIKNDVGSQLALMEAKPRHNTVDVPTISGH